MGHVQQLESTWVYLPIGVALAMVGLYEIGVYIVCLNNIFAYYIANYPIMDLYLAAERRPRMRLLQRWWDRPDIDNLWIREENASAEMGEDTWT